MVCGLVTRKGRKVLDLESNSKLRHSYLLQIVSSKGKEKSPENLEVEHLYSSYVVEKSFSVQPPNSYGILMKSSKYSSMNRTHFPNPVSFHA
ncbi:hypothetical protein AVEN_169940-1 [Araneus ventricosus]|uniref:Uncharacterized protein n=1 Tax=Araneus ventricosus TaxID=182803 RepID=A0A4Y2P0H6_ARAVE|nr:hypothetical protein AVEN_66371-1 [Araneus ventricosus]GBN44433.1 hypothetical protein AVEN_169940-1 [Araneus ventricosus]